MLFIYIYISIYYEYSLRLIFEVEGITLGRMISACNLARNESRGLGNSLFLKIKQSIFPAYCPHNWCRNKHQTKCNAFERPNSSQKFWPVGGSSSVPQFDDVWWYQTLGHPGSVLDACIGWSNRAFIYIYIHTCVCVCLFQITFYPWHSDCRSTIWLQKLKKNRVVGIANSIVEQHWGQSSPVPNMHYAKTLHDFIHPVYNQIGAEICWDSLFESIWMNLRIRIHQVRLDDL